MKTPGAFFSMIAGPLVRTRVVDEAAPATLVSIYNYGPSPVAVALSADPASLTVDFASGTLVMPNASIEVPCPTVDPSVGFVSLAALAGPAGAPNAIAMLGVITGN